MWLHSQFKEFDLRQQHFKLPYIPQNLFSENNKNDDLTDAEYSDVSSVISNRLHIVSSDLYSVSSSMSIDFRSIATENCFDLHFDNR